MGSLLGALLLTPTASADAADATVRINSVSPSVLTNEPEVTIDLHIANLDPGTGARATVLMSADPMTSVEQSDGFLAGEYLPVWSTDELELTAQQQQDASTPEGIDLSVVIDSWRLPLWNPQAWGAYGLEAWVVGAGSAADGRAPHDRSLLLWYPEGSTQTASMNVLISGESRQDAPPMWESLVRDGVTVALTPTQLSSRPPQAPKLSAEVLLVPEHNADLSMLSTTGQTELAKLAADSRKSSAVRAVNEQLAVLSEPLLAHGGWLTPRVLEAASGSPVLTAPQGVAKESQFAVNSVYRADPTTGAFTSEPSGQIVVDSWGDLTALLGEATDSEFLLTQRIRAFTAISVAGGAEENPYLWANLTSVSEQPDMSTLLAAIFDVPWITPVSLAQVLEGPTSQVSRETISFETVEPVQATTELMARVSRALSLASAVLGAPPWTDQDGRVVQSQLLSTATAGLSLTERTERVASVEAELNKRFDTIRITPIRTVNVLNSEADFPVTLSNSGEYPVQVEVNLQAEDSRLQVKAPTTLTVPPGGNAIAQVPVVAVGAGDVSVKITASAADGTVLDDSQEVLVRVRPGLEDTVTWTAAAVLGAFFIWGLIRTLRKGRRGVAKKP